MTRHMVLVLGVVLAGVVAFGATRSGHSPRVSANIAGENDSKAAPAVADGESSDEPADTGEEVIDLGEEGAPAAHFYAQESARVGRLLGDLHLADQVDLQAAKRDGDAYVIDADDQSRLVLTLDHVLQEAAESALTRARARQAAIVVMSVDGRILALAGRRGKRSAPNMATDVWAPAASVFKVITASALVQAGVRGDQKVCYHGGLRSVTARNLKDDRRRDRRCNHLGYAVAKSQNAIIGKLAHRHLNQRRLQRMARAFGFENSPPFALSVDVGRLDIPKDGLAFARVAAGFWHTELSPIGGAMVAATVASGGYAVTPQIVDHVRYGDGGVAVEPVPARRVIERRVARAVADMMVGTTEYGTARKGFRDRRGRRFLQEVKVAGKTGTLTQRKPDYMQYSWFVGFAPVDEPEFVISVLIGNPEKWHLKAHTAARMVLQKAF